MQFPTVPDLTLPLNFWRRRNYPQQLSVSIITSISAHDLPLSASPRAIPLPTSPQTIPLSPLSTPTRTLNPVHYHEAIWNLSTHTAQDSCTERSESSSEDDESWWSMPMKCSPRCNSDDDIDDNAPIASAFKRKCKRKRSKEHVCGAMRHAALEAVLTREAEGRLAQTETKESLRATAITASKAELSRTSRVSFNESVRVRFIERIGHRKWLKKSHDSNTNTPCSPPRSPKKTKQTNISAMCNQLIAAEGSITRNIEGSKDTGKAMQKHKLARSVSFRSRFPLLSFTDAASKS